MIVFNSDLDPIYQGTAHTASTGYAVDDRVTVFADPKTQAVKSHNLTQNTWFDGGINLAHFNSESLRSDAEHGVKYRVVNAMAGVAHAGDYVLHMPAPTVDDSYYLNVTPDSDLYQTRTAEADVSRMDLASVNDGDTVPTAVITSTMLHACTRGMANDYALFTQPQALSKHYAINGSPHIHSFSVTEGSVFTPFTGNAQDLSNANLIGAVLSLSTTVDGVTHDAYARLLNNGQAPTSTSGIQVFGRVALGAQENPPVAHYDLADVQLYAQSDMDVVVEYFTFDQYQERPTDCPV